MDIISYECNITSESNLHSFNLQYNFYLDFVLLEWIYLSNIMNASHEESILLISLNCISHLFWMNEIVGKFSSLFYVFIVLNKFSYFYLGFYFYLHENWELHWLPPRSLETLSYIVFIFCRCFSEDSGTLCYCFCYTILGYFHRLYLSLQYINENYFLGKFFINSLVYETSQDCPKILQQRTRHFSPLCPYATLFGISTDCKWEVFIQRGTLTSIRRYLIGISCLTHLCCVLGNVDIFLVFGSSCHPSSVSFAAENKKYWQLDWTIRFSSRVIVYYTILNRWVKIFSSWVTWSIVLDCFRPDSIYVYKFFRLYDAIWAYMIWWIVLFVFKRSQCSISWQNISWQSILVLGLGDILDNWSIFSCLQFLLCFPILSYMIYPSTMLFPLEMVSKYVVIMNFLVMWASGTRTRCSRMSKLDYILRVTYLPIESRSVNIDSFWWSTCFSFYILLPISWLNFSV